MANRFIDVTLRLIDRATTPLSNIGAKLTESSRQWIRAGNQIQKTGQKITKTGTSLTTKVSTPIVGLGAAAVKTAASFEAGMSKVQATSGASGKQLEKLSAKAKEMGAKTKFSATEATDAFNYMAMAGWKTGDMMNGIEPIMKLAGATNTDLASTSDIVTDALTAFGKTSKDTTKLTNIMASASANANTNVSMLGESYKYVAPVAGSLGYSMKDTTKALALMANAGIKASQGGTSLRAVLTNMAKPSKTAQGAMDALGLSLTDSNGKMKPLNNLMLEMRQKFSGLTEAQKAQYAASLAGKTGMSGLLAIVNASDKDWKKLSKSITDGKNACGKMYDVSQNNLNGALTILKSTVESIAINFGERLTPYVKKATQYIQSLADKFNSLNKKQQDTVIKVALVAAAVGPTILIFGKMVTTVGKITKTVGKAGEAFVTFKSNARAAQGILSTIQMPKLHMPNAKVFTLISDGAKMAVSPVRNAGTAMVRFAAQSRVLSTISMASSKTFGVFGRGLKLLYSPLGKVGSLAGTLGKSVFALLGPVGTAILVVGALVAAGILLYKNWDKVKKTAGKVFNYVKSVFNACGVSGNSLKKDLAPIGNKFTQIGNHAKKLWVVIEPVMKQIASTAKFVFGGVLGAQIGVAIGIFSAFYNSAKGIISGILKIFDGIITFLTGVFTGNWKKAWSGIKEIFSGVFQSFVSLCKMPLNAVIGAINGAIAGINKLHLKIPKWVPGMGGKEFGIHIPTIPQLAKGTQNWKGGIVQVHEQGGEIIDLPKGSRVYPHDKSVRQAYKDGQAAGGRKTVIQIPKLADTIVVREDADIDKIVDKLAKKLEDTANNVGGGDFEYIY